MAVSLNGRRPPALFRGEERHVARWSADEKVLSIEAGRAGEAPAVAALLLPRRQATWDSGWKTGDPTRAALRSGAAEDAKVGSCREDEEGVVGAQVTASAGEESDGSVS